MNKWTIGKRITFGFIAILALAIVIGIMGLWGLRDVNTHTTSMIDDSVPGAIYMGIVKDNISQSYAVLERHILTTDEADIKALETRFSELSAKNKQALED